MLLTEELNHMLSFGSMLSEQRCWMMVRFQVKSCLHVVSEVFMYVHKVFSFTTNTVLPL